MAWRTTRRFSARRKILISTQLSTVARFREKRIVPSVVNADTMTVVAMPRTRRLHRLQRSTSRLRLSRVSSSGVGGTEGQSEAPHHVN